MDCSRLVIAPMNISFDRHVPRVSGIGVKRVVMAVHSFYQVFVAVVVCSPMRTGRARGSLIRAIGEMIMKDLSSGSCRREVLP